MTADTLTRARALLDGITPGEWQATHRETFSLVFLGSALHFMPNHFYPKMRNDADFIAAAPALVRELCAELDMARAVCTRFCIWHGEIGEDGLCPVCGEEINTDDDSGHDPDCPYPVALAWDRRNRA